MAKFQSTAILGCALLVASIVQASDSPFGAPTTNTTPITTTAIPTTHVPVESSTPLSTLPVANSNGTLTQNSTQSNEGHDHDHKGIGDLSQTGVSNLNSTSSNKHLGHSNAQSISVTCSVLLVAVAPIFVL